MFFIKRRKIRTRSSCVTHQPQQASTNLARALFVFAVFKIGVWADVRSRDAASDGLNLNYAQALQSSSFLFLLDLLFLLLSRLFIRFVRSYQQSPQELSFGMQISELLLVLLLNELGQQLFPPSVTGSLQLSNAFL